MDEENKRELSGRCQKWRALKEEVDELRKKKETLQTDTDAMMIQLLIRLGAHCVIFIVKQLVLISKKTESHCMIS